MSRIIFLTSSSSGPLDGKESVWGEAWEICDGKMNKICETDANIVY